MNDFLKIELSRNKMDNYFIRSAILGALKNAIPKFEGKFLDVGCGKMPYKELILQNDNIKEYCGLDIETAIVYDQDVKPDFTWDGKIMPFESSSFDSAMATEVLEHCPEPLVVLGEINRVLKPGSFFFFTVPFLWNLHEAPHDEYRYTPFALERLLKESGFASIEIQPSGGWHAAMAQMLGLWLIRSNMPLNLRRVLKVLLFPVYKLLLKHDTKPKTFKEGTMIPSLTGVAIKA